MSRNYTTLAGLLLFALCLACAAQSPVQFGFGSSDLAPVKFGGKKLPSWLSSDYAPIFNGVNQYAEVTGATGLPAGNSARTIMGWVYKYRTGATSECPLFYGTAATGKAITILFDLTANTVGMGVQGAYFTQASTRSLGWHHVAATLPAGGTLGSFTFYIDALELTGAKSYGSGGAGSAVDTTNSLIQFGKYASLYYTNAALAEWSIWNRALSQSEILRYKDKRLKGTESGLVAYYPLNEAPGSTVFVDKVGGKNAVGSNSIQITRRNGYAAPDVRSERYCLSFDGVDDLASGTQTAISTYPYTIESWIYVPALAVSQHIYGPAIQSVSDGAKNGYIDVYNNSGAYTFRGIKNNNAIMAYVYPNFPLGSWHHLAVVNESSALSRFYVNGNQVATNTADLPFAGGYSKMTLGSFSGVAGKGKSAEARIWSTARTENEIKANMYIQMTGSETGLVHHFKVNEGTGTTLTNTGSAGASSTLTLLLGPTWVGRDIP